MAVNDVTLTNVNDDFAPTDILLDNSTIDEGQSVGTLIGVLSATDLSMNDTFAFELVTGQLDNDQFQLQGDQLLSNAIFDFETQNSYSVRVRVTDSLGFELEKTLIIEVTEVAEIGETGNDPNNATVNATDQTGARDNFTSFFNPAALDNPYDFNRDKRVNATDQTIARDNFTSFFSVLRLISPPAPASRGTGDAGAPPTGNGPERFDNLDQIDSPSTGNEGPGNRTSQPVNNLPELWNNVYQTESAWQLHRDRLTNGDRASASDRVQPTGVLDLDPLWGSSDQVARRFDHDGQAVRFSDASEVELETLDSVFVDDDLIDWEF